MTYYPARANRLEQGSPVHLVKLGEGERAEKRWPIPAVRANVASDVTAGLRTGTLFRRTKRPAHAAGGAAGRRREDRPPAIPLVTIRVTQTYSSYRLVVAHASIKTVAAATAWRRAVDCVPCIARLAEALLDAPVLMQCRGGRGGPDGRMRCNANREAMPNPRHCRSRTAVNALK